MKADHFAKRSDVISIAVVGSHLLAVLSPIYLVAALGPGWHTPILLLIFGLSMNGVLNLMHECAHILVFKRRDWSDVLGRWIVGPLVFADFDGYRERHWAHHKFIGEDGDTKDTYLIDIRRLGVVKALVRCASMAEAIGKFFRQGAPGGASTQSRMWFLRVALVQLLFASSLLLTALLVGRQQALPRAAFDAAVAYAVFLYGLMSVTVFMASLRAVAEHHQYDTISVHQGHAALRNFACNPVSRYLMGAYGFGEHFTHHRVPGIPYYHLPAATPDMAHQEPALTPTKDYFDVLIEIIASPAGTASRQQTS